VISSPTINDSPTLRVNINIYPYLQSPAHSLTLDAPDSPFEPVTARHLQRHYYYSLFWRQESATYAASIKTVLFHIAHLLLTLG
jgi:hypothetical protein